MESSCTTLYKPLLAIFALSSAMLRVLFAERHFFQYPTPIPAKIWGVPFGVDSLMLVSTESEDPS